MTDPLDGSTTESKLLEVGAVIGNGSGWGFLPEIISLTGHNPPSAVSATLVPSGAITDIGFYVTEYPFGAWSAGPHDVTLLVQPAGGAVQIPEPTTWTLVALGAVALVGRGRLRRR